MKTRLAILAPAALLLGLLCLASCAQPLENPISTNSGDDPITIIKIDTVYVSDTVTQSDTVIVSDSVGYVDTVIVVDTLVHDDTVIVVDTLIFTDTLYQTDTVYIVDTVIIYLPDSSETYCRDLSKYWSKICWLLDNAPGRYRLEFAYQVEYGTPPEALNVRIEGEDYTWMLADDGGLTVERDLPAGASIKVWPDYSLAACGWKLKICVTITPL